VHFYNVQISRLINGIKIEVGCKTFVFNDINEGLMEVVAYFKNPYQAIAHWKAVSPDDFKEFDKDGKPLKEVLLEVPQDAPQGECGPRDAYILRSPSTRGLYVQRGEDPERPMMEGGLSR
jgi:hypothetical protein